MLNKLATLTAFAKAPRATYMLRHPLRGTKRIIFLRGLRSMITPRAGATLGAAVAIPLAVRAVRSRNRMPKL